MLSVAPWGPTALPEPVVTAAGRTTHEDPKSLVDHLGPSVALANYIVVVVVIVIVIVIVVVVVVVVAVVVIAVAL